MKLVINEFLITWKLTETDLITFHLTWRGLINLIILETMQLLSELGIACIVKAYIYKTNDTA